ncbi:MAG: PolC-type DNA polymerase III [Clostridia bacterium]|nr:PolC-type DNA polymerase III [Clostridia bacterium]
MAIVLSGKDSKFNNALTAMLSSDLLERLQFDKAVISDDGSIWELYFLSSGTVSDDDKALLNETLKKIVPPTVTYEVEFVLAEIDDDEDIYASVPVPEFAPESSSGEVFEEADNEINDKTSDDIASAYENEALNDIDANNEDTLEASEIPARIPEIPTRDEDSAQSGDSAMERYRKRMEELSKKAAEHAVEFEKTHTKKPSVKKNTKLSKDGIALLGKDFPLDKITPISELSEFSSFNTICGDVINKETKEIMDGKKVILTFAVTDYTSTICGKFFLKPDEVEAYSEILDGHIAIRCKCIVDDYTNELTIKPFDIKAVATKKKTDDAPEKRIEMHLHTKMSQMDGLVDAKQLVKLMLSYGHDTVAITDHGVVQAFTDMEAALAKCGAKDKIKLIFGVEGYLLDDDPVIKDIDENARLADVPYCIFSLRTTGSSALTAKIFEIGACIWKNGKMQDKTFYMHANPHVHIDSKILEEAGVAPETLASAPEIEQVLKAFNEFSAGCVLVSHSAAASLPFLCTAGEEIGIDFDRPCIDTLRVSRETIPTIKSGKLNKVCDALNVKMGELTDSLKEAEITAVVLNKLIDVLAQKSIFTVGELNRQMQTDNGNSYHIILYATNKTGLFNLYSLITESHLHHLRRKRPQMPRSEIIKHREGLLIASACEAGELYRALLRGVSDLKLEKIADFYDYLEIQPLGNNDFLVREGAVRDTEHLIELNKKIIALGEKLGKPVIATGDVHYLQPNDAIFRSIIQCAEGYPEADIQAPLYYRTTQEMLDEFWYLDEKKRHEIVIENPRKIADLCEPMESFPRDHLYTPEMDNAENELREMCMKNAYALYGNPLPEIVEKRLNRELESIISNGYAVLYLIAHKVVKKSNSDGYFVGSRGSVGSSFAATMANITEVNPLQPHYVCPNCKHSDFDVDKTKYDCGIDMPVKACPKCNTEMMRLGFNIPFEVFMGFDGDKVPDIDLNFSGVYQPKVHKYIEELFGSEYVFRAGTIGGVAEKTAIGYTKKFAEEYGKGRLRSAEIQRLASGCIDVKRTTGQHAGGVVIVPKQYNINCFTPLQYPANDPSQGIITTHFTFNSLHDTLLKADILGHDDPTVIRMLEDLTGLDTKTQVPLDDPKVMSLFLSPEALGVTEEDIDSKTGTLGLPEFGTGFTRKMLEEAKPTTFSDLVKISGLSHGTDVWTGNAQDLIANGTATISECICTREDIMNTLIQNGCESFLSFDTMEKVRKGKGIPEKYLEHIREHNIPEWFIESCNKIKYMFPKAHAAAYVTTALRVGWYKVYKPHQYYTTYFTVRADDFEVGITTMSPKEIRNRIAQYKAQPSMTPKEKGIVVMLEMVLEMKMRGINFTNIDIYASEATAFTITEDNLIRPPLNAVPGLGETAAESIVEARKAEPFKSQDDLLIRTKLSSTLLHALEECGCLKNLPKSQQISLFDF